MKWNYLDLSTYIFMNLWIIIIPWIISFFIIMFIFMLLIDHGYDFIKAIMIAIFCSLVCFIVYSAIALIPTHDKLLELKIKKIKNEAVTNENIDKGLDKIESIVKKLEEKYLK